MSVDRLLTLADRGRRLIRASRNQAPRNQGDWYRIVNATDDRAEIYLYGAIGSDWYEEDVTAASFVAELRGITAPAIDLHINSGGGLVFDGIAIHSALANHAATIDVSIDGLAASAASFVAMAGDTVAIEKPAKMFIHDAHGIAMGGAAVMRELADLLDELSDTIAEIYADRAGGTVAKWRAAMREETWYGSRAAVDAGLADRIAGEGEHAPTGRAHLATIRARAHRQKAA